MKHFAPDRKINIRTFILSAIAGLLLFFGFVFLSNNTIMPQGTIYCLNDVTLPQKNQTVVVFSPHPDDETLGAGGYIAKSIYNGASVYIVLVTDGDKRHLKDARYSEFQNATSRLGVPSRNLIYLNYQDGKLTTTSPDDLTRDVQKQIDTLKPDFLIYSYMYDEHPDHAMVGKTVHDIVSTQTNRVTINYQYLIHEPRFPQSKKYRPDMYLLPPIRLVSVDTQWLRYMLTPDQVTQKKEAVEEYTSQLRVPILGNLMRSLIRKNELFLVDLGETL